MCLARASHTPSYRFTLQQLFQFKTQRPCRSTVLPLSFFFLCLQIDLEERLPPNFQEAIDLYLLLMCHWNGKDTVKMRLMMERGTLRVTLEIRIQLYWPIEGTHTITCEAIPVSFRLALFGNKMNHRCDPGSLCIFVSWKIKLN